MFLPACFAAYSGCLILFNTLYITIAMIKKLSW